MKRWIFAVFSVILIAFSANATVNDGHVTTTVGYVTHELDTRQDEFPAQSGTKAMTFGDDAGEIGAREVKSNLGSSTSDDSLPTVSAVNDGLDATQDTIAAENANKVLTYTGTAGDIGAKGIYQNSDSYVSQTDSLVAAGTFNDALRNGLESEFVCVEYDPAEPDKCWLWEMRAFNPMAKTNYFIMGRIPEGTDYYGATIVRNSDGSLTITLGSNGYTYAPKLSVLAPGLEIGKRYKLSITTTGKKLIYLSSAGGWDNNQIKTITANMLNSTVFLYATTNSAGSTATISSIRIEAVDGYTPIEYLESTGTQYIDTNILLDSSELTIKMDFTPTVAMPSNRNNVILGTVSLSGVDAYLGTDSKRLLLGANAECSYTNATTLIDKHIVYNGVFSATSPRRHLHGTINGINFSTQTDELPINANVNDYVRIFGHGNSYRSKVKLRYVQIYKDGVLAGDFVPVRRNSDGAIGMLNNVTNTFFGNSGSGAFVAGPEIYLPQNQ